MLSRRYWNRRISLNKLTWAERDLITARAKLNTLVEPLYPVLPLRLPHEMTLTPVSLAPTELEKLALEQRPELRASAVGVNKAEKTVELAEETESFLTLCWGYNTRSHRTKAKSICTHPMLTLTIPFSPWTKGKHDYEVEQALAERQGARSNLEGMEMRRCLQ